MAGKKGRSGRRKLRDEEKRTRVIEKAWDVVEQYLNDDSIDIKEKIKTAEKLAQKDIPQELDAQIQNITRMPCVKIDGEQFIPLMGTEVTDQDDNSPEVTTDTPEAAAPSDES